MRSSNKGKGLSDVKNKMLIRQYRIMKPKINWTELGRRCGVHPSTAKKYIEKYIEAQHKGGI